MDCDVVYDNVYYILHHCRQLHHAVPHSRLVDSYLFHKTMMQLFEFQNSRVLSLLSPLISHCILLKDTNFCMVESGSLDVQGTMAY